VRNQEITIENSRNFESHPSTNITSKVELKKTIFGVHLLKKTDNKFLKEARELNKQNLIRGEDLMRDKIEELKSLRQNIDALTPKTVSSHGSDLIEMPDVDYNDPESYRLAQKLLEEKQKEREERKKKKQLEQSNK